AYFRAAAEFQTSLDAAKARGEAPAKTLGQFDAEWDAAHPKRPTDIAQVLDQIDHAIAVLGEDHVGIGSDFDGVGGALPAQLKTVADYPNLVAGMRARGHSDAVIRKVLGENLLRAWRAIEAKAAR
ncbi:membrane dipeptidase, partial [Tolypothrix campylonemoides VB511288]